MITMRSSSCVIQNLREKMFFFTHTGGRGGGNTVFLPEQLLLKIAKYMTNSQMFWELECNGGPIFKVVLECRKRCSEPFLSISVYGIQCDFMQKNCQKQTNF